MKILSSQTLRSICAAALSAVVALTALTGCGGSSGSSSAVLPTKFEDSRIAAAANKLRTAGSYLIEYDFKGRIYTYATNGSRSYAKYSDSTDGVQATVVVDGEKTYIVEYVDESEGINLTAEDNIAIEVDRSTWIGSYGVDNYALGPDDIELQWKYLVPKSENVTSFKADNTAQSNRGVTTSYNETLQFSDGGEVTYCFNGDTPAVGIFYDDVMVVKQYTSSVDGDLFQLPSQIMSEYDYYEEYIENAA